LISRLVTNGYDVRALIRSGCEQKVPQGCIALVGMAVDWPSTERELRASRRLEVHEVRTARTRDGRGPVVVVSAMSKVTDALLGIASTAGAGRPGDALPLTDALCERHKSAVRALVSNLSIQDRVVVPSLTGRDGMALLTFATYQAKSRSGKRSHACTAWDGLTPTDCPIPNPNAIPGGTTARATSTGTLACVSTTCWLQPRWRRALSGPRLTARLARGSPFRRTMLRWSSTSMFLALLSMPAGRQRNNESPDAVDASRTLERS